MTDIVETLRIMADNIDATRPEHDYSAAHRRVDDADIAALRQAASLIVALRKVNNEMFDTGIKSVRDTAELAIELREVKKERDKLTAQLDEYRECFANLALERDGLWSDLERVTKERDEARRMACEALAAGDDDEASEYARLRNWDCFPHTDGASYPENPDNSQQALDLVTKERDEARRECCTWQGLESGRRKQDVAVSRGWDYLRWPDPDALDRLAKLDEECGL